MTNPKIEQRGDTLVITIDTSKAARDAAALSQSGKTRVLATTRGFTRFGDVGVSLNCTVPLS